jgi:molecular chaperone DnaK
MTQAIGLDLGTTFSAAAVVRNGRPELLINADGGHLTPSVVLFGAEGEPLVGEVASRSATDAPDDCVQFVKRHMGDPHWSVVDPTGKEHRPEEISAIILRRLVQDASAALGGQIRDVVITVPAYFDDLRRTATRQAGEIAGLNVLRLINEPTAAAVAYGITRDQAGTFLVYDLGGGTFDVTILRSGAGEFEVIGTEGDRNLGGFDFDNELMKHVAKVVQSEGGPELMEDPVLVAELREKCELAKRRLTTTGQAAIIMRAGDRNFRIRVTREEFEVMTRDLLERTEIIAEGVLEDAGLTWERIDQVLLVGGSTRMPMVRELVRRLSGKAPAADINPDEAVALGAAIVADQAAAGTGDTAPDLAAPVAIRDVTSQALGTTIVQDKTTWKLVNDIIIPRNTKIPCRVEKTYVTMEPGQRGLLVDITEGDSDDPEYVAKLIEREIPLPAGLPDNAPIRHIMRYDIDGLIHLELIDDTNNRHLGEIELDRPLNLDRNQVDRMRQAMRDLEVQ